MDISIEELTTLSQDRAKDYARIAELERMVKELQDSSDKKEKEIEGLRNENAVLRVMKDQAEFTNTFLREYIILSAEKIKTFNLSMRGMKEWAFLRSFISWVLPEKHRLKQLEHLDEVMKLPKPDEQKMPTIGEAHFDGPMYDVHGNDKVNFNSKEEHEDEDDGR